MNMDDLLKYVCENISNNKITNFDYVINNIPYKIIIMPSNKEIGINIPSLLAIPLSENMNRKIIVESNNMESENLNDIVSQGKDTLLRLINLTSLSPVVIPLIPSYKDKPYFQQLSKECFGLKEDDSLYRIDEQVINIINQARNIIKSITGIDVDDKVFLNGYSASGVFAQRFSLLYPEIIDTVCIGGASGSIPLPINDLPYPLGIKDYEQITNKKFDMNSYSNIKFRYYVGEYETKAKSNSRFDEKGNNAPMHDMSYFDRSIPVETGEKQRQLFGQDMFERARNTIDKLKSIGIDIEHYIIKGRSHNNNEGIGVNEIADNYIHECYNECVNNKIL